MAADQDPAGDTAAMSIEEGPIEDGPIEDAAAGIDQGAGERIARRIARAGRCSRRDAERWIAAGRVVVNGTVLTTPAVTVRPGDTILVDGTLLPAAGPTRLWRFHKPAGLITTARDPRGRPTVFDRLPSSMPRTLAVGRLDLPSEGLLLLTTDGALAHRLEQPETGWTRRYRVRVHGTPDPTRLDQLADGIRVDGIDYGPIQAVLDRQQGANAWLTVSLKEGRNREIRRVMAQLGLTVNRLIRTAYGPFQLGNLDAAAVAEVPAKTLREQLGGSTAGWAKSDHRPPGRHPGPPRRRAGAKTGARQDGPGKSQHGKSQHGKSRGDKPQHGKPRGGKPGSPRPGTGARHRSDG